MSKIIIPSKNIYQAGDVELLPDNIVDNVNVTHSWQAEGNETETFNAAVYSFDNIEPETSEESSGNTDATQDKNYPVGYSAALSSAELLYKTDYKNSNYEIITKDGDTYRGGDVPFSTIEVGEPSGLYGYTMESAEEEPAGSGIWRYTFYLSGFQGQLYKFHFDEDIPIDRISLQVNPRFQSTRRTTKWSTRIIVSPFYTTSKPISNRTYPLNDDTDVIAIDKSATYTSGETVRENSDATFATSYDYNLIKANSISDIVAAVYNSDGTIKTECLSPRKFSFSVEKNPDYNWDTVTEVMPDVVLMLAKYPSMFFENLCFTTKAFYIKNADNSTDIFCVIPYAIKYATRASTTESDLLDGTYQYIGTITAAITNVSFIVHRDVVSSTTLYTNTNDGKTETTVLPNENLGNANYSIDIGEFGTGGIAERTSSEIYNKYKNGIRQLTLKCSISDYYDENGEVAIDINSLTKGETYGKYIYKYIYQEFIGESWRDDYWSSDVRIKIDNPYKYYMLNSPDGLGQTMYYMNSANDSVVATVKTIPPDLDTSTYQILSYRVKIITYNVYAYDKDVYIYHTTNGAYLRYRSTDIYTKDLSTIGNGDCIYIIPNEIGSGSSSSNYFYQVDDFDSFDDVVEKIKNGDLTVAEITEIIRCRGIIARRGRYCKIAVVLPIWTYGHYKPSGTNFGEVRYYDVGEVEIYSNVQTYDKNMTFVGGETVIPYRATKSDSYGNTIEEPYLTDKNGNPIAFDVVKVKVYSDGAVWQELTLQEHVEKT